MAYFLSKIGKHPLAKLVLPTTFGITSFGYFFCHIYAHDAIRDLYTPFGPDGIREKPSENLQKLVLDVEKDILEKKLFEKVMDLRDIVDNKEHDYPYTFFISNSPQPISFGARRANNGALVGIPQNFNYEKTNDIPDSAFSLARVQFFKDSTKNPTDTNNQKDADTIEIESRIKELKGSPTDNFPGTIETIVRDSDVGEILGENLIMSDKAKKFAIAKEILRADSFEVVTKSIAIILAPMLPVVFVRSAIKVLNFTKGPVQNRLVLYAVNATLFYYIGRVGFNALDTYYDENAEDKVYKLGSEYIEGAREYYNKISTRNKIFQKNTAQGSKIFDEHGNVLGVLDLPTIDYRRKLRRVNKALAANS